jgi:hypothetical protein
MLSLTPDLAAEPPCESMRFFNEKCSNPGFDAKTHALQTVEIKLIGGDSVSVSSDCKPPDFLIVSKLNTKTGFTEIYNGEFPVELWKRKSASKRKVVSLRLNELTKLRPAQDLCIYTQEGVMHGNRGRYGYDWMLMPLP